MRIKPQLKLNPFSGAVSATEHWSSYSGPTHVSFAKAPDPFNRGTKADSADVRLKDGRHLPGEHLRRLGTVQVLRLQLPGGLVKPQPLGREVSFLFPVVVFVVFFSLCIFSFGFRLV